MVLLCQSHCGQKGEGTRRWGVGWGVGRVQSRVRGGGLKPRLRGKVKAGGGDSLHECVFVHVGAYMRAGYM